MKTILRISCVVAMLGVVVAGCGSDRLPVAPVTGKVFYQGKPLEFGSVMFQPDKGPAGRGTIQPDGSFTLSTYSEGDGAVIGQHKVRIASFASQRPDHMAAPADAPHEPGVGHSQIPRKYSNLDTSGLRVEVKADNEPFEFHLTD